MALAGMSERGGVRMTDLGTVQTVTARKRHRCEVCYGPIPQAQVHSYMHGKWDGEWQNWHAHRECMAGLDDDEFMPGSGEMPARVVELMEQERAAA